jgi:hypothetical protein
VPGFHSTIIVYVVVTDKFVSLTLSTPLDEISNSFLSSPLIDQDPLVATGVVGSE